MKRSSERANNDVVTKHMILGEVARLYPKSAEIMLEYGLHCVGCFANAFDTIEDAMKIHGLTEQNIGEMVARINKIAVKSEKNS